MLILGPKMPHLPPFWANQELQKKGLRHSLLVLTEP